jgi:hypothetical protein
MDIGICVCHVRMVFFSSEEEEGRKACAVQGYVSLRLKASMKDC